MKNIVFRNVGQNHFEVLPHQGLKTIIELKAHNNPKLKDFPSAEVSKLQSNSHKPKNNLHFSEFSSHSRGETKLCLSLLPIPAQYI